MPPSDRVAEAREEFDAADRQAQRELRCLGSVQEGTAQWYGLAFHRWRWEVANAPELLHDRDIALRSMLDTEKAP